MGRQLPAPDDFGPDARDLWSAAQRQLRRQGTWERTDLPLLEMYVRNLVAARQARETSDLYRDSSAQSPERLIAEKTARDAEGAAFALAKVLLLTPEARKRHGITAGKGGMSELDALTHLG